MSKKVFQLKDVSRLNLVVAAGIAVLVALTGTVLSVELRGLNGITGNIAQDKSTDWSAEGPNASFAAVIFYRNQQLRAIANLEITKGVNPKYRQIATKLATKLDGFDSQLTSILKNHGVTPGQLKLPMPNLYADYGKVNAEIQGTEPALIDNKFHASLGPLETSMSRQLQADVSQVAAPDLKQLANQILIQNLDLITQLKRQ